MTKYKRGDVVLVDFGFSEGEGVKKRPALIISADNYHKNRQEVIISAITSNIKRILFGDTKIDEWEKAGLMYPSINTGIIRTVKEGTIIHRLGTISPEDFQKIEENLKRAMGL